MNTLIVKKYGSFRSSEMAVAIKAAFDDSLANTTKLPTHILKMPGYSGMRYRIFINNLLSYIKEPRYLEIGSWSGSTACAALWGNSIKSLCIDNWSQFNGPKDTFLSNIEACKGGNDFAHIEADFRKVDYNNIGTFNVILYDGPHEEIDQLDGIVMPQKALTDSYILVVDDYNWPSVRNGTFRALNQLCLEVECSIEVRTSTNNVQPPINLKNGSEWHNGYYFALVNKPR